MIKTKEKARRVTVAGTYRAGNTAILVWEFSRFNFSADQLQRFLPAALEFLLERPEGE
jgi:hypothetical protein